MMLILLNSTIILSILITFMSHPMSMGMILLMQVLMITLITGSMSFNYWFSYILFLIMVGGMLVLFIYMTSIASNEKFEYSKFLMLSISFISMMLILFSMIMDNFIMEYTNFNINMKENFMFSLMMTKFINFPYNMLMATLIVYLFITLIAVVKISNIKYGPLRQMSN